jgi:hypothetical protein
MSGRRGGSICWFSHCSARGTSLGSGDLLLPDGMVVCPEHREKISWAREAHRLFLESTDDGTGRYSVRLLLEDQWTSRLWAQYVESFETEGHAISASNPSFRPTTLGSPAHEILCSCGWHGQLKAWVRHTASRQQRAT